MSRNSKYPAGITPRAGRGTVRARVTISGERVLLGEWPDTPDGIHEASDAIYDAKRAARSGRFEVPDKITVADYYEEWITRRQRRVAKGDIAVRTHDNDILSRRRLVGRIGSIRLVDLSPDDVDKAAVDLLENGRHDGGPLAPQTVTNTIKTLTKVLNDAISERIIMRNVASGIRIRRIDEPDVDIASDEFDHFDGAKAWTRDELTVLLSEADGILADMMIVAAATGLRRSELAGLLWRNVDLDGAIIRVRSVVVMEYNTPVLKHRTKTYASRRTIAIPQAAVLALRRRRAAQAANKLAAGELWNEPHGAVFTWEDGRTTSPEWFTKAVQRAALRGGVKPLGAHGLRHTFATISLEEGVPLVAVAETLGHADVGITAATYSHVTETVARSAAATVGVALFGE
jgi:integrase